MQLRLLRALVLVSIALPCVGQDQRGLVRVTVKMETTEAPISGVELSLESLDQIITGGHGEQVVLGIPPHTVASGVTDQTGTAVLRVPDNRDGDDGNYSLFAKRSGYYVRGEPVGAVRSSSTLSVNTNRNREVNVVIYLVPVAAIRGRVVTSVGIGLANVRITPGLLSEGSVRRAFFLPEAARTNQQGEFLVVLPSPGIYLLRATRESPASTLYYPGQTDLQAAGSLSLGAGEELTRIEIVFP